MTVVNEGQHAGGFLLSDANGTRSRDIVKIASGAGALKAGTVLGRVAVSGEYVIYNPANVDGSEVAAAVLYGNVDASTAAANAVAVVRDAEINKSELIWFSGATVDQINAGVANLATVGIIAR